MEYSTLWHIFLWDLYVYKCIYISIFRSYIYPYFWRILDGIYVCIHTGVFYVVAHLYIYMYSCTVGPVVAHAVVHFPGSVVDVLGPTRYTNHDINLFVSMYSRVSNLRFSTGAYQIVYESIYGWPYIATRCLCFYLYVQEGQYFTF